MGDVYKINNVHIFETMFSFQIRCHIGSLLYKQPNPRGKMALRLQLMIGYIFIAHVAFMFNISLEVVILVTNFTSLRKAFFKQVVIWVGLMCKCQSQEIEECQEYSLVTGYVFIATMLSFLTKILKVAHGSVV